MLRRLIFTLFLLANLTSQVSVAFACGMMAGGHPVVVKHCCCKGMAADAGGAHPTADGKNCCQIVVDVSPGPGHQMGHVQAETKLPDLSLHLLSPVLLPALFSLVLEPASSGVFWEARRDTTLNGLDLYLHTQRLRL
jgi:hypothetical protein